MLQNDILVTIHQRNLQTLAIEIFKVKNSLLPETMKDVFKLNDKSYSTTYNSDFQRRKYKIFVEPEIGNQASFRKKIKYWSTNQCPCRIYKKFVNTFGFVN